MDDDLRIWLARHAETEWSRDGRHTGRTDLPLTERGRAAARRLGEALAGRDYTAVLTSPLQRASETCRIAGFADRAEVRDELAEWDYGGYEGVTTPQVHEDRPGWVLWRDGAPGGEQPAEVADRVDRVVGDLRGAEGDVVVFSHGHLLRALALRWIGAPIGLGHHLVLDTGTLSVLGTKRGDPVIRRWNDGHHLG